MNEITFPMVVYSIPSDKFVPATLMAENGSALIASYMEREGIRPLILDYNTPDSLKVIAENGKDAFKQGVADQLVDIYRERGVRIAAAKMFTNGFHDELDIFREVKERLAEKGQHLTIVAHGPHANWYGKGILRDYRDVIDLISVGDGEMSAVPLVKQAYGGGIDPDTIPNLMWLDGDEVRESKMGRRFVDLNELPTPIYREDVYPAIGSKMFLPMLDDSRGCSFGLCTFCAHPVHLGPYRERDPQLVNEDAEKTLKEYGINRSRLVGSLPTPAHINRILVGMPEGHKTNFFGRMGGDYDYDLMKGRVGALFTGLESIRPEALELYKKCKAQQLDRYKQRFEHTIRNCKDIGTCTTVTVIVPSPRDTTESTEELREYVMGVNPDFVIALPLGILPGSPMDIAIARGEYFGVRLDDGYHDKLRDLELDLLRLEGFVPPYQMEINGELTSDFLPISRDFMLSLMGDGIYPVADEIITMAEMYYGGFSEDQAERRGQIMAFAGELRDVSGKPGYVDCNPARMREMIDKTKGDNA